MFSDFDLDHLASLKSVASLASGSCGCGWIFQTWLAKEMKHFHLQNLHESLIELMNEWSIKQGPFPWRRAIFDLHTLGRASDNELLKLSDSSKSRGSWNGCSQRKNWKEKHTKLKTLEGPCSQATTCCRGHKVYNIIHDTCITCVGYVTIVCIEPLNAYPTGYCSRFLSAQFFAHCGASCLVHHCHEATTAIRHTALGNLDPWPWNWSMLCLGWF